MRGIFAAAYGDCELASSAEYHSVHPVLREPLLRSILASIDEIEAEGREPNRFRVFGRTRKKMKPFKVGFGFPWVSVLVWLIPKLLRWWFSAQGLAARGKQ